MRFFFAVATGTALIACARASQQSNPGQDGKSGLPNLGGGDCPATTPFDKDEILKLHNDARAAVHAQPLTWDDKLAGQAQCWADRCQFEHSQTPQLGENIACGSTKNYSPFTAFQDWWEEFSMWHKGMDFDHKTGHYTQVAWKGTKAVGCGVSSCPSSKLGLGGTIERAKFVVCNYYPAGNVIGQFDEEVELPRKDPIKNNEGVYAKQHSSADHQSAAGTTEGNNKSNGKPCKDEKDAAKPAKPASDDDDGDNAGDDTNKALKTVFPSFHYSWSSSHSKRSAGATAKSTKTPASWKHPASRSDSEHRLTPAARRHRRMAQAVKSIDGLV